MATTAGHSRVPMAGVAHASYDHGLLGNLGVAYLSMCVVENIFKDKKNVSVSQG